MLRQVWDYAERHPVKSPLYRQDPASYPPRYFSSPTCGLKKTQLEDLKQICIFSYPFYHFGKRPFAELHAKKATDMANLYVEMFKMKEYRDEHNYEYAEDNLKGFSGAVPLSRDLKRIMGPAASISNPEKSTDFLIRCGLTSQVFLDNGYGYSYKGKTFANHYHLNDPSLLKKLYVHIFGNSFEIFSKIEPTDKNYKLYLINKYSILLQKNPEYFNLESVADILFRDEIDEQKLCHIIYSPNERTINNVTNFSLNLHNSPYYSKSLSKTSLRDRLRQSMYA